ncbi:MAG: hypothetical protein AAB225_23520 [Acidobacteriota bacterium]
MGRIALPQKTFTVFSVSPFEEDRIRLDQVFAGSGWKARGVRTCREALTLLRKNAAPVVICERDLPDGNWKDIWDALTLLTDPPALIVTSRLADEYLWAEVLNLGGWDVLAKPLDEKEVVRAVDSARRHWNGQRERARRVWEATA